MKKELGFVENLIQEQLEEIIYRTKSKAQGSDDILDAAIVGEPTIIKVRNKEL